MAGLPCTIVQLSQHDAGNEDFICIGKSLKSRGILGKDCDNNIGIEEEATTHSDLPLRSLLRLRLPFAGDRLAE